MNGHGRMDTSDPRQDRDPAMWGKGARLQTPGGVYVVQFPGRIKVGKAGDLRVRVLQHKANGATRAVGLRVDGSDWAIEREALRLLGHYAEQVGTSESFVGISFVDAESVLSATVRKLVGDWPEIALAWNEGAP